jgi:hypothetical protein
MIHAHLRTAVNLRDCDKVKNFSTFGKANRLKVGVEMLRSSAVNPGLSICQPN